MRIILWKRIYITKTTRLLRAKQLKSSTSGNNTYPKKKYTALEIAPCVRSNLLHDGMYEVDSNIAERTGCKAPHCTRRIYYCETLHRAKFLRVALHIRSPAWADASTTIWFRYSTVGKCPRAIKALLKCGYYQVSSHLHDTWVLLRKLDFYIPQYRKILPRK